MYFPPRVARYIIPRGPPGIINSLRAKPLRCTLSSHGDAITFTSIARPHHMMTERDAAHSVQGARSPQDRLRVRAWRRRRVVALGMLVISVALAACNGALPSPSRDASQGQMMMDLAEALNQIRDQSASLQDQVDSLREVVYHQDTIIRQLALGAGITVPPPR